MKYGLEICAGKSRRGPCLKNPTKKERYRLIRVHKTKPCIKTAEKFKGSIVFKGLQLTDVEDTNVDCFSFSDAKAGRPDITFAYSGLENFDLNLQYVGDVTFKDSTVGISKLTISSADKVTIQNSKITRTPLTISSTDEFVANNKSNLSGVTLNILGAGKATLRDVTFGSNLSIDGSTSLTIQRSTVSGKMSIKGEALRKIEDNTFSNAVITLDHTGKLQMTGNIFKDSRKILPKREPPPPVLTIVKGVNYIFDNSFGKKCTGEPGLGGSVSCTCAEPDILQMENPSMDDRTTQFVGNWICTKAPAWAKGEFSRLRRWHA